MSIIKVIVVIAVVIVLLLLIGCCLVSYEYSLRRTEGYFPCTTCSKSNYSVDVVSPFRGPFSYEWCLAPHCTDLPEVDKFPVNPKYVIHPPRRFAKIDVGTRNIPLAVEKPVELQLVDVDIPDIPEPGLDGHPVGQIIFERVDYKHPMSLDEAHELGLTS